MNAMPKKILNGKSHKQKLIDELDTTPKTVVGKETVAEEQPLTSREKQGREKGWDNLTPHQFKPGQSGNPGGRPKDVLKEIGKRIAKASVKRYLTKNERQIAQDLDLNPDEITMIESIMLGLATSKNPAKIEMFLERVYGRVPNLNINTQISESLVARFRSKLTDAELERIGAGEDALQILLDKLPDVEHDESIIDAEEEEE